MKLIVSTTSPKYFASALTAERHIWNYHRDNPDSQEFLSVFFNPQNGYAIDVHENGSWTGFIADHPGDCE